MVQKKCMVFFWIFLCVLFFIFGVFIFRWGGPSDNLNCKLISPFHKIYHCNYIWL